MIEDDRREEGRDGEGGKMPPPARVELERLPVFKPDLYHRAWSSTPHPTLPLLATAHENSVTVFSLSDLSAHSNLTGGHTRSVRSAVWRPGMAPGKLCLVTGSFDSTAGLWRWEKEVGGPTEVHAGGQRRGGGSEGDGDGDEDEWEFTLVLEGHENEVKSVAFAPSGHLLATCSRDKSIWIWEDVGASEGDDEWETVSVLTEHDGDVKCVAWCPDVPGRASLAGRRRHHGPDALASASYDDTVRVWREDPDAEWVCAAVLDGHVSTVWGVQWEPNPSGAREGRYPRMLTWSADATVRVWTLVEDDRDEENREQGGGESASAPAFGSGLGNIPNTMRQAPKEEWRCTAVLPKVHTRDIYSASWSRSGLVASTGSDGIVAVYAECDEPPAPADGVAAVPDPSLPLPDAPAAAAGKQLTPQQASGQGWRVLGSVADGHGPYEINHVTWCPRFDPGAKRRGVEEMLVTTGDDGVVRPWQLNGLDVPGTAGDRGLAE
ncbi:hypothetical protein RB595_004548 [Gaeumannomyces hyphopodioides]